MFGEQIIQWIHNLDLPNIAEVSIDNCRKSKFEKMNKIDIALVIAFHIQQLRTNVHAITKLVDTSKWHKIVDCDEFHRVSQNQQERLAISLYPNSSLSLGTYHSHKISD